MRNAIIIAVLAFTLPFIGCRSNDKDKLVGDWRQIPFTNPEEATEVYVWRFYAGDGLVIVRTETEGGKDSVEYTYDLDGSKLRLFDGDVWYNGEYWIDELGKEYLKMTKKKDGAGTDAWVRYEFALD